MNTSCESVSDTETITGPYDGYYLASYAVEAEEGYVAFAKICPSRPRDIWKCDAVKKVASDCQPSPTEALMAATTAAKASIAWLRMYQTGAV